VYGSGIGIAHQFLPVGQAHRHFLPVDTLQADALEFGVGDEAHHFLDQRCFFGA
jgi:hypothetical protein